MKSIIFVLCFLFSFGNLSKAMAETVHLRWATPHEPNHVVLTGAHKFKEIIEKESKGKIKLDILSFKEIENIAADRTTGTVTAEAVVAQLKKGKFDVSQIYLSDIAQRFPELNALRLPYLLKSHEHLSAVVESPVGAQLLATIEPLGVKGLGIGYSGGQEVLASSGKLPRTPSEFAKIKVRPIGGYPTIESEAFSLLGAINVHDAVVKGRDYSALPKDYPVLLPVYQKMLAGTEDLFAAILTDLFIDDKLENQFTEKVKGVVVPGMFYYTSFMIIEPTVFAKFTPNQQKMILRAGKIAAQYERDYVVKLESTLLNKLQTAKVKVVEYTPQERQAFEASLQPLYDRYKTIVGEETIGSIKKLTPKKDRVLSSVK